MKILPVLLSIIFLFSVISAQEKSYSKNDKSIDLPFSFASIEAVDTLHYMNSPGVLYTSTNGGYVNGQNGYGDTGKYQRFDITSPHLIKGATVLFGAKTILGNADDINIVVRSAGGEGEPGVILFSSIFTTSDIDTTGWTSFTIPSILVSDTFFIGFEWVWSIDDQFGIISDESGSGNGSDSRVWERWGDNSFHQYNTTQSWDLDIDLWIGAVLDSDITNSVDDILSINDYQLLQNYPNPFNPGTNLKYRISNFEFVTLKVYDILGNEIAVLVNEEKAPGSYEAVFNAGRLSSGIYFYKLSTPKGSITKKMILQK